MKYLSLCFLLLILIGCERNYHTIERNIIFTKNNPANISNEISASDQITTQLFRILIQRGFKCIRGDHVNKCTNNIRLGEIIYINISKPETTEKTIVTIKGTTYEMFSSNPNKEFLLQLNKLKQLIEFGGDMMVNYDVEKDHTFLIQ